MIKIAIVTKNLEKNGISAVIMNYVTNMNLKKFEITIFAGEKIDKKYQETCNELGINIVLLRSKSNKIGYYKDLKKKLQKNYYDILHVHGNSSAMAIEMLIGKKKKIKVRIAHCHNTEKNNTFTRKVLQFFFNRTYTDAFACGKLAGKALFENKDFYIMRNGVDTLKYRYDESTRNEVREDFKITDKIVLGHIGRFNSQKNHQFLLDVFEELAKEKDDYVLLLVGTGPDFEMIKARIDKSKYKDRIILSGETDNPEKMYLAMDLFVFPSLYEGLPLTLVEAQISGLPCIISDVITDEIKLSNRVAKLPINDKKVWKDTILNTSINEDRKSFYDSHLKEINLFDIKDCVNEIENKYVSML